MIAFAERPRCVPPARKSAWQAGFLSLLPEIRKYLRFAFRNWTPEEKEEAITDCLANAAITFARLCELGKASVAYPSVLARFAAAQYRSGRRVGCRLNINDVMAQCAQRNHGIRVTSLDCGEFRPEWKEVLVENRNCTPAELAASRIDFQDWLTRMPANKRPIAARLASGESTGNVAREFRVSAGRISQLRREFEDDWREFHGEKAMVGV